MARQDYDIILRAQNASAAAFRSLRNDLRATQGAARGLQTTLGGAFAPLAGGLGAASLVRGIRNATAELAKLKDEAKRVGTSTDAFQALQVTLEKNGGEAQDAARALERFGTEAAKAANGGTSILARVLADNNVQMRDASGNMRDTSELLVDYARLVANAGSQQEKLALASEAYGRNAGPKMVEALEKIAKDGLPALIEQGKRAGDVIDRELIERAAKLDNAFKDLERSAGNAFKQLAVEAAPALLKELDALVSAARSLKWELGQIAKGNWSAAINIKFTGGGAAPGAMAGLMDTEGFLAGTGLETARGENQRQADFLRDELERIVAVHGLGNAWEGLQSPLPGSPAAAGSGKRTNTSGLGGTKSADKNRTQEILASLKAEGEQLTFNLETRRAAELVEQQINLVRRAGVDASEADKAAIMGAAAALQQKQIAFEDAKQAADALSDVVSDIFDIIAGDADNAGEAVKKLIKDLLLAEAKASLLRLINPSAALGPISAIFQGAGGLFANRAGGGRARAGQPIFVGEEGKREVFVPDSNGTVMPAREGGGAPRVIQLQPVIHNYAGAEVETGQTDDGQLEVFIRAAARDEMASPRGMNVMQQSVGARPRLKAR
jgi:hypothetical protein